MREPRRPREKKGELARRLAFLNAPLCAGVYAIVNEAVSIAYIGSVANVRDRWFAHYSDCERGVHHSAVFQSAWDQYGAEAFAFILLEECGPAYSRDFQQRYETERRWADHYRDVLHMNLLSTHAKR